MTVRVLLQGFGAMGRAVLRALEHRIDAEVVAVLDVDSQLVGKGVGDLTGVGRWSNLVVQQVDEVDLTAVRGEVAVHATTAFAAHALPQLERLLGAGFDVVTLCQELVYPVGENRGPARALDEAARRHGLSVVAAGVNPGWILDLLPVAASLGCVDIRSVSAERVVDFSPYGPDEMAHIGAGYTPADFTRGARAGTIGHIGLLESAALVGDELDLGIDRWEQTKAPVVASRTHRTPFVVIDPGHVRGFRQEVRGWAGADRVLEFVMLGLLDCDQHDPQLGDRIHLVATPEMSITVHGDDVRRGGEATAGVATNLIGPTLEAPPGLHSVASLPLRRSRRQLRTPASVAPASRSWR